MVTKSRVSDSESADVACLILSVGKPKYWFALGLALIATCFVLQTASTAQTLPEPNPLMSLNWDASRRWVHVDTVVAEKREVFERARLDWLTALRTVNANMRDGRPLVWSAIDGRNRIYLTFYPFQEYEGLQRRDDEATTAIRVAGKKTVDAYDRGDAALVPPHYTQLWSRVPEQDYVPASEVALTEVTGGAAHIEFQQADFTRSDEAANTRSKVFSALKNVDYPLTLRTFRSSIGDGLTIRLWLAKDEVLLREAGTLRQALIKSLGEIEGARLALKFADLYSTRSDAVIVRRADLSNLEQAIQPNH